MKKIIVSTNNNRFVTAMFRDTLNMEEVTVWDKEFYFRSKVEYYLFRLHTSKKINNLVSLPGKAYWIKHNNYAKIFPFVSTEQYHIILFNTSLEFFPEKDLIALSERNNVEITIVLIDSCGKKETRLFEYYKSRINFKNVITFDLLDAEKYGYTYSHEMYSKFPVADQQRKRISDIYFIGYNKGRAKRICALYDFLSSQNINCDFTINGSEEELTDVVNENIYTNRYASYQNVIDEIQGTKCILEMLQEGQGGTTLRYYEAVCYNKKLLTNNQDIVNYPYYKPEFMKIYKSFSDIDLQWLKMDMDVDYKYRGDFSPVNLVRRILFEQ